MVQSYEQMLRELQDSILFEPGFPKRISCSHEQWEACSKQEIEELYKPRLEAIQRARNSCGHLEELVRRLGEARYEPAIPALACLWRECALVPVRTAAGRALFAMRVEEARSALASMIEDSDSFSLFLGVRAIFDQDPDSAYDTFESWFRTTHTGSPAIARAVLSLFVPGGYSFEDGKEVPVWTELRAPGRLKRDPRWLELCARLRRDHVLGDVARDVLRHADQTDITAVLDRVRQAEPPTKLVTKVQPIGDLLARYRSGEFEAVWWEIRSHQRIGGEFREEVLGVAEETMTRVARNADLISARLQARGWRPLFGELRTKWSPDDLEVFGRIEAMTQGPIPPSLRAFWTVVGGIDWVWNYNCGEPVPDLGVGLPMDEMDPLCVAAASQLKYLFDEWEDQRHQPDPDLVDPFSVGLAPDDLHKANISGGGPYSLDLPFFGADPLFAKERHKLPFVDYLRLSFRWAGFPGLDEHADREDVRRFVEVFGQGCEPF